MPIREVAQGVYRMSLSWSCVYLLWEGKAGEGTLIDCGLQSDLPDLLAGLREVGCEPSSVGTLILTHAHCDHAGNAAYFAGLGTRIVTHSIEAPYLRPPRKTYAYSGLTFLRRPITSLAFRFGEVFFPVRRCPVDRLVEQGDRIEAPGGTLIVHHAPGHTRGQIALYRESDSLLFSGDAILNIVPIRRVVDLRLAMRLFSDDWDAAKVSARHLAQLRPNLLLPGHGPPLSIDTADRLLTWASTL